MSPPLPEFDDPPQNHLQFEDLRKADPKKIQWGIESRHRTPMKSKPGNPEHGIETGKGKFLTVLQKWVQIEKYNFFNFNLISP